MMLPTRAMQEVVDATTAIKVTPREAEILTLMVEGLTDKEIAARLSVSTSAIRRHLERLTVKWNKRGRVALGVWWYRHSARCCATDCKAQAPCCGSETSSHV